MDSESIGLRRSAAVGTTGALIDRAERTQADVALNGSPPALFTPAVWQFLP